MKPRHTAEQSTVKVNKSVQVDEGAPAKRGFGAASAPAESAAEKPAAAPARRGFGGL